LDVPAPAVCFSLDDERAHGEPMEAQLVNSDLIKQGWLVRFVRMLVAAARGGSRGMHTH